jgi:hypothetical protein
MTEENDNFEATSSDDTERAAHAHPAGAYLRAQSRAVSATHPHVRSPTCTTRHRSACARRRPGGDGAEVQRAERTSAAKFEVPESCWKKMLLRGARGSLLRGGRWAVPCCGEPASPGQHHTAHLSPYSFFGMVSNVRVHLSEVPLFERI